MAKYKKISRLEPGSVDRELFSLLINISSIRSVKVICALEGYFVHGIARKIICEKYNVNPGYLSLKIREIQNISASVYQVLPFYIDKIVGF
ncbi:PapB/FocB family fimbrial expression transcriptional regulator [Escherichia coli]|uniref:PapB/FocB family fimbrial expression transcriptional regulator n=1 Tax=Escherichia coli TaxID=562 RepID=UPI000B7EFC61|nr:PapB/FocB family fimbrial expression transcriptional regulator [Escherichia coli]HBC8790974.1 hypothetical protein [Citrobacter braakii]EEY4091522.1 hypothetical protein [Escherichia coli]MCN2811742.1 adhesin biosynthesis transcription regulatory family protein [Escherichia coli]HAX2580401.1 hypothetical protein [Escherichia coli]HAY0298949.1 hypothetical protein [Escherichia coli]